MRTSSPPYWLLLSIVLFFAILVWIDSRSAYTQGDQNEIFQLTDTTVAAASSSPSRFTELNGTVFFGTLGATGGLWKTDGTSLGTEKVIPLHTIVQPSLHSDGELLYFSESDEFHNSSLWRSDGTAVGTFALTTTPNVDPYENYVTLNNRLYFVAFDAAHGSELWQTDGTPAGTNLFADLNPGPSHGYPSDLTIGANTLYFTAIDAQGNRVLWQSDGTPSGTEPIPTTPEIFSGLTAFQGEIYFTAYDKEHGAELWKYAPNESTLRLVADINPGSESSSIYSLAVMGDRLFFAANDGVHGHELWRSDGTEAGTVLVKDIVPGGQSATIDNITAVGSLLYFTLYPPFIENQPPATSFELWKSDGTGQGTVPVKTIDPAPPASSIAYTLTAMGDELYFRVTAGPTSALWKSDGTDAGTMLVKELDIVSPLIAIGDTLFFSAASDEYGTEPWISDGTAAGTTLLKDVDTNMVGPIFERFAQVNNRLYFTQSTGELLARLWMSDGSTVPAIPLSEQIEVYAKQAAGNVLFISGADETGFALWKHSGGTAAPTLVQRFALSPPANLVALEEQLFFMASNTNRDIYDIWRSDGTAEGTIQLLDGNALSYNLGDLVPFNGRVFAGGGNELWVFDGSPTGTTHFVPNGLLGNIHSLLSNSDALYFTATRTRGSSVSTIWRSDGTPEGTQQLRSGTRLRSLGYFTPTDHALFFTALDAQNTPFLWYDDGESPDVIPLMDLTSSSFAFPNPPKALGEQLFFTLDDGVHGSELWKSDGTVEGTVLVKDIAPAELERAYPGPLFAFGNRLVFGANDGVHGQELWLSDGTADGTVLVKDIAPGEAGSMPRNFVTGAGRLYFDAHDGSHGRELWESQGDAESTVLVTDLYSGTASSYAQGRLFFNSTLYFTGNNGVDGQQLFGLHPAGVPLALPTAEEPTQRLQHRIHLPIVSTGAASVGE